MFNYIIWIFNERVNKCIRTELNHYRITTVSHFDLNYKLCLYFQVNASHRQNLKNRGVMSLNANVSIISKKKTAPSIRLSNEINKILEAELLTI